MIEVITGDTVLLELVLADGDTTRFPQAEVYDSAGVAIVASPVNLSHVADGLYQGTFTAPAIGGYSIIYITYSDVGHTTLVGNIERVSEHMRVTNAVQDDVWSEALPGAFGVGEAGKIVGDNVNATISSRSTLTQADILSDATPFAGALIPNLDATVSSRGTADPGDNMGLTAAATAAVDVELTTTHGAGSWSGASISQQDVRDAMKLAPTAGAPAVGSVDTHLDTIEADTAVVEPLVTASLDATISSRSTLVQADILSDATPFPGADIDAAISSRSSHTAADVDALVTASHGAGSYITATGFAVAGDNMGLTAAGVDAVWDEPIAGHLGVGSVGEALNDASSGAGVDWTVSERSQMRQALGITGATLATAAGELQDVLADTAAIEPLVTTNVDATISSRSTLTQADILSDATPFPGADIDAAISTRSSHTAADVDALVTVSHGVGSYITATGFAVAGDNMGLTAAGVDGIWDEPIAGHLGVGTTGESLDNAGGGSSPAAISTAVWSEALPGVFAAGEAGQIVGDNLDATVSSRAAPADNMGLTAAATAAVDVELSAAHGAGAWTTGGAGLTQQNVRDAMKLAPTAGLPAAGSVDTHLDDIEADTGAMQPVVAANLDATVSSRGTADPGDAMTLTAGERAAIDTELSGTHGAGLWESDSDTDWTSGEKEQIRQALGVAGATAATGAGDLQDVLADTGAMEPAITANIDATVSSRAAPGDAMTLDAAGVDAIFDEPLAGHLGTGTAGQALAAAFGNAGGNVRDDALTYDANDRPLTLRRRIFPDAATASASTPGGIGEGEVITVTIAATQIDAAKWETLLRTI